MKKLIGSAILKILGWKLNIDGDVNNLGRCVLVVAPHTHNIEYILGNFVYWKLGKPLKIIIKDAHTKAWYGGIIKALGGIGINRSQKNDMVKFAANEFKKADFSLVITPEGTRSRVKSWKKGFYYIAKEAKIPLVLAVPDFKRKVIHIGYKIPYEKLMSVSYEEILQEISDYIKSKHITPKVIENWNPIIK